MSASTVLRPIPTLALLLGIGYLAGCSDAGSPAGGDTGSSSAPAATPSAAERTASDVSRAGSMILTHADGSPAWTLRLDGSHVEVSAAGGERLIGEQRGEKRRYRRESDGAAFAEVKHSDTGFKLRTPDSELLWKVRFGDDKLKVSDNEENEQPWVLKTDYDDKVKVLAPDEREIGEVRFQAERIKVRDASGNERFLLDGSRRSAAYGVLLMEGIPEAHRGILMAELLSRDR